MHIWVFVCILYAYNYASDGDAVGSCLPYFIEMLRINSCFNLYEFLKDRLCWGFTPSDFICLIKGSSYLCVAYNYPLCIANLKLKLYGDNYFLFNSVKMENVQS